MALNLDQLIKEDKPIYVENISKPRASIILTMYDENGRSLRPFNIPNTWIPFNLSEHYPAEILRRSVDLRQFLVKRILKLVEPDKAEAVLKTEDGRLAKADIDSSEFSSASAVSGEASQDAMAELEAAQRDAKQAVAASNQATSEDFVMPRVKDIMMQLDNKDIGVRDANNKLRAYQAELTQADLSYIISRAPEGQLRNWAKNALAETTAGPERDVFKESAAQPSVNNSYDDEGEEPVLTPEQQAAEVRREAEARQTQKV